VAGVSGLGFALSPTGVIPVLAQPKTGTHEHPGARGFSCRRGRRWVPVFACRETGMTLWGGMTARGMAGAFCAKRTPMTARAAKSAAAASPPYQVAAVVAGVVALAIASRVAIPVGVAAPITLQTYALFVLAGVFGGRLALTAVLAWLALAALGAPVLADGAGGWRAVVGHTMGFLVGMAAAAWVCGQGAAKVRGWAPLTALFLAGHAIVLAVGWAGLASFMDPGPAFTYGIAPFLPGAVAKSLAAAVTVWAVKR
jgi:biotin transport system substrate-specific component